MICCCSMAGTIACKNCSNRMWMQGNDPMDKNNYTYRYGEVFHIDLPSAGSINQDYLKIISNLNQHIADLQEEVKRLKEEKDK